MGFRHFSFFSLPVFQLVRKAGFLGCQEITTLYSFLVAGRVEGASRLSIFRAGPLLQPHRPHGHTPCNRLPCRAYLSPQAHLGSQVFQEHDLGLLQTKGGKGVRLSLGKSFSALEPSEVGILIRSALGGWINTVQIPMGEPCSLHTLLTHSPNYPYGETHTFITSLIPLLVGRDLPKTTTCPPGSWTEDHPEKDSQVENQAQLPPSPLQSDVSF